MKKLSKVFVVFSCLFSITNNFAQVAGDYGSLSTGSWGINGNNWLVFVSSADWSDATSAPGVPGTGDNVWIRAGHTVTLEATSKTCKNLTIEASASLLTALDTYTLTINGDALIDGVYGGSGTGILTQLGATGKIYGAGSFYFSRLMPATAGITMTLDMNSTGVGAGACFIHANALNNIIFEVKSGRALTLPSGAYISVGSNSYFSDPTTGANFKIDIYGSITTSGATGNINLANKPTFTTTLNVYNGGSLNMGGSITALALGTADPGSIVVNVADGGTIVLNGATNTNMAKATTTINGTFDWGVASSAVRSMGTATIGSTGKMRLDDGTFPSGITLNSGSTVEYYGASPITMLASPASYSNLQINNSAGVTLGGSITVNSTLTLTSGLLTTTSSNLLTIGSAGTISGGSATSFVNGPMTHTWTTATATKTYPLGKGATYRPLDIALTTPASPVLSAEVFNANAGGSSALDKISTVRYYQTSLISGTANSGGTVKITYGADDGVSDFSQLVVAICTTVNGIYLSQGGTSDASSVTSVTAYDPSTGSFLLMGSTGTNALPVELTSFTATVTGSSALLFWSTATEVSNYGFDVERASTSLGIGMVWQKIGFVKGNGNSNSAKDYSFTDKQKLFGKYNYRLKQIDNSGAFKYSDEIEVEINTSPIEFNLAQNYPNPFNPTTTIKFSLPETGIYALKIFNTLGEEVAQLVDGQVESGYYSLPFDASQLASGLYIYNIKGTNVNISKKMILMK